MAEGVYMHFRGTNQAVSVGDHQIFNVPLSSNFGHSIITLSQDIIDNVAKEALTSRAYTLVKHHIKAGVFSEIGPVNLNPLDEEGLPIYDKVYEEIDYGGIHCVNGYSNVDGLGSSGAGSNNLTGVKIVKNLHVKPITVIINNKPSVYSTNKLVGGSKTLREYYGDIEMSGGTIHLFDEGCLIQKCVGEFKASNITSFELLQSGFNKNSVRTAWFNVLDIRDIDTSNCKKFALLNGYRTPCTIILGNFSTEKWKKSNTDLFMKDAPVYGRSVVMTTVIPPVNKNCNCDDDGVMILTDGHLTYDSTFDWISRGRIERIYVPQDSLAYYLNDTIDGDTSNHGKVGWSRYGCNPNDDNKVESVPIFEGSYFTDANGKNDGKKGKYGLFSPYDPEKRFLVKREGGKDGKPVWLYRAPHRR